MIEERVDSIISSIEPTTLLSRNETGEGTSKKRRCRRHRHRRRSTTHNPSMDESANNLATKKNRRWRKQRKKSSSSTCQSNSPTESTTCNESVDHNIVVSSSAMDDALQWFLQLPSGRDRALAMAISDVTFIRTFIELLNTKVTRDVVLKQHSHCSNTTTTTSNKPDSHIRSGTSLTHTFLLVSREYTLQPGVGVMSMLFPLFLPPYCCCCCQRWKGWKLYHWKY